jgi:hypothetical protein
MGDVLEHPSGRGSDDDGGGPTDLLTLLRRDLADNTAKRELILAEIARMEPQTGPGRLWLEYRDLFDAALTMGEQYPTGFPTLDKMTDGGLARGTVTIIQGKPGVGKTLVATQIARALAPRCAVACLFADEGLAGARVRIGQQLGLDRRRMRRPDDLAREEASRAMTSHAAFWRFMQPRSTRSTIETLAEEFDRMAPPGLPRVWLLDSAQVIKAEGSTKQADRRLRVSDLMWRTDELSERFGAIALLVSQVGRGSYASKDKEKRTEDLAAGLETSAIEYVAELTLHIDGNPKKTVEIRVAKNRYTGDLGTVPCRVDFQTATFHELDVQSIEIDKETAQESEVHEAKKAVLEALNLAEGLSGRQVIAAVLLRGSLVYLALKSLARDGAIRFEKGPKNSHVWRVVR